MYPTMLTRLLRMCRVNPSSDSDKVKVTVTCSHYHIRTADAGLLKIDRCWASSPVLDKKNIYICGECTLARLICSLNLCHRWYILSNIPPLIHLKRPRKWVTTISMTARFGALSQVHVIWHCMIGQECGLLWPDWLNWWCDPASEIQLFPTP